MEIKTCEQYVLAELANKEKTIANLNDEIARLNDNITILKQGMDAKEASIQTCRNIIKILSPKVTESGEYFTTDCFERIEEVKSLLDFIVDELHISVANYTDVEEK